MADEQMVVKPYPFTLKVQDVMELDFSEMLKEIAEDVLAFKDIGCISGKFHETIVQAVVSAMEHLQNLNSDFMKTVVMSGGSFHNRYLRKRLNAELLDMGFNVYLPEYIPCNDGGLSYGQLTVATAKRRFGQCVLAYRQK
nr:hypothetical protein [Neobacillus endophyticus]